MRGIVAGFYWLFRAQQIQRVMVVKPFRQTIRTDQKNVARLTSHRPDLRVHELISAPQRLLEHIPPRMRAGLPFVDLPFAKQPADMRIVVADLFDAALARRQIINPTVPDVTEIHPTRREPAQAQRRLHPLTFLVALAEVSEGAMHLGEQLREHVAEPGVQAGGALAERFRQQGRDLFHRNLTGILTSQGPAHPVAHGKSKVGIRRRSLAYFSESLHLARIKLEAEEGILVVLAHLAHVGPARPFQGHRDRRNLGLDHAADGGSAPGSRVANSKSITQKRPSAWR